MKRLVALLVIVTVALGVVMVRSMGDALRRVGHQEAGVLGAIARWVIDDDEVIVGAPGLEPPVIHAPVQAPIGDGEWYTVELFDGPVDAYADPPPLDAIPNATFYAGRVAALRDAGVQFDANLSIAAGHILHHSALLGRTLPSGARNFLLRASGAVDAGVSFYYLQTNAVDAAAVDRALTEAIGSRDDRAAIRVGVSEVLVPGARLNRRLGVLVSRRRVEVESAPREIDLDELWVWRGRVPASFRDLSGMVLYPEGRSETLEISRQGDDWTLEVPTGSTEGTMYVQLLGTRNEGPGKILQVPVEVGRPASDIWRGRLPPDESKLTSAEAAERYAIDLVNAERSRAGRPALLPDPRLSAVARRHSADMRDAGFFGHLSPSTGLMQDRLAKAGYRAMLSGENVALDASLTEAHAGLMHSISHRANILGARFTRIGIGIVGRDDDGSMRWWVTQLFAEPVETVDRAAVELRVGARINRLRAAKGLVSLERDRALTEEARRFATVAAAGDVDDVAADVMEAAKARDLLRGRSRVWLVATMDVDGIEFPDIIYDRAGQRLGLGIDQHAETGLIGVVLLLTE